MYADNVGIRLLLHQIFAPYNMTNASDSQDLRTIPTSSTDAVSTVQFGAGTGPIHLDNVACIGTEARLIACHHSSHADDCSHSEDAGVHCQREVLYCSGYYTN